MNLTQLRNQINSQYLGNGMISAAEAKELVKTVAGDGLTAQGKKQLEKLRTEFKDQFSSAGLAAFDSNLAKQLNAMQGHQPGSASSPLGVRLGRGLDNLPTSFNLAEVPDPQVRNTLSQFDFNADGKINDRDRSKMGFTKQQWNCFIFAATLQGRRVRSDDAVPRDLTDKTVCFTAVGNKEECTQWAREMGAKVVTKLDENVDFLIVGTTRASGKDERAHVLNHLGLADITVANEAAFRTAAFDNGVSGDMTRERYEAITQENVADWFHAEFSEDDNYSDYSFEIDPYYGGSCAEYLAETIVDMYDSGDSYKDSAGNPIPKDRLEIVEVGLYLGGADGEKAFLFDTKTAELVDETDHQTY